MGQRRSCPPDPGRNSMRSFGNIQSPGSLSALTGPLWSKNAVVSKMAWIGSGTVPLRCRSTIYLHGCARSDRHCSSIASADSRFMTHIWLSASLAPRRYSSASSAMQRRSSKVDLIALSRARAISMSRSCFTPSLLLPLKCLCPAPEGDNDRQSPTRVKAIPFYKAVSPDFLGVIDHQFPGPVRSG